VYTFAFLFASNVYQSSYHMCVTINLVVESVFKAASVANTWLPRRCDGCEGALVARYMLRVEDEVNIELQKNPNSPWRSGVLSARKRVQRIEFSIISEFVLQTLCVSNRHLGAYNTLNSNRYKTHIISKNERWCFCLPWSLLAVLEHDNMLTTIY
jgi:hypothetical protein